MKFLVITRIPEKQGILGPIPGKHVVEEAETESFETLREGLHVPLGGECKVVPLENVVTIKARIVNETV